MVSHSLENTSGLKGSAAHILVPNTTDVVWNSRGLGGSGLFHNHVFVSQQFAPVW